ncbi:hypothetical protein ACLB2K_073647 [Fragaria x ananassa]
MRKIAVEFFKDFFDAEPLQDLRIIIPSLFPDTSASEIADMSRLVSESDAHDALFRIGQLKAPGVDGFPALFFQNHWDLCAPEIVDVVKQAFSSVIIPAGLNHTLITLVPKISAPKHMHLFRPISLCCTVYKIISKIIVDRIRPMLKKWISPNQVSFVPGKQISDNIMIAQEILHKCKNAKGTKGFMAWKVDLSKAYDRLNWNFIEQVLYEVKIPIQLVKLIMSCVSTASYQIVLNGELSESFTGSKGIRQGDPLSPYLFVLCMEKLSHTIQHAIEMNYWKPIQSSQSGPFISHLFFADDLILFSEASTSQATIMKCCMDTFCNLSGQSVSLEKSMVYCSPNVSSDLANRISSICGSPITEDLGVYLGMPLIHSRVSAATYSNLVDKVQTRLASWKSKTLNMAGRLTLIQSVTSSIPIYAMQTAKLPVHTCERLDRLNRNFLWGDSDQKKKVHLTNWDMVCRPKCFGGLGIKRSADMNRAMLAKASWRMAQGDNGLWNKIYQQKYLHSSSMFQDNYKKPSNCSPTWTAIVSGASLLNKGMRWRIGNGCTAKFWSDKWSPCGILNDLALIGANIDLHATTKASAKHKMQRVEHVEALSWIKTVLGVHKLNVDGSRTRAGDIGAGGIIRDSSGCWCGGFMVNIGAGEVLQAEAWGLFYGIQLALSMKIPKLEIESDSAVLVNLLQNSDMDVHPLGTIVLNCRAMMQHFDFVQIKHIHRERNMVADLLAKNSTLNAKGICIFNEPPDLITNALLDDIVGVTRCRTVNTSSAG